MKVSVLAIILSFLWHSIFIFLIQPDFLKIDADFGIPRIKFWGEVFQNIRPYSNIQTADREEIFFLEELFSSEIDPEIFSKKPRSVSYQPLLSVKSEPNLQDRGLKVRIRNRWQRESKMPKYLSFALRAAFKHMHLYAFKAGLKEQFISSIIPDYLDPENTVEDIAKVFAYLNDNPGCTRKQLFEVLQPNEEEMKSVVASLSWLIEKGHIIEFFNGHLAAPLAPQSK